MSLLVPRVARALARFALLAGGCALLSSGCALFGRSQPRTVQLFDPEPPRATAAFAGAGASPPPLCEVALDRVSAADELGAEIAYRDAGFKAGTFETRLWTERPEAYLRRALARALFEEGRCRRSASGDGPRLDVELVAFELDRPSPERARVAVHLLLRDDRTIFAEESVDLARPVPDGPEAGAFDRFVGTIALALREVAVEVAERVRRALPPGSGVATAREGP